MKKILIVDDIKGWRDFHANAMKEFFGNDTIPELAENAREGYDKIIHSTKPYDIIISDLQMEEDFSPKYAGEWFVEQIQTFKEYANSKIVIISAAYNIRHIAETLNVQCIPKSTVMNSFSSYKEMFL